MTSSAFKPTRVTVGALRSLLQDFSDETEIYIYHEVYTGGGEEVRVQTGYLVLDEDLNLIIIPDTYRKMYVEGRNRERLYHPEEIWEV